MSAPRLGYYFVPMPQEIWDQSVDLSLAEFRLYGYLIRHQLRLGKAISDISLDELMNGMWTLDRQRNKVRLDQGCGLSRNAVKQAIVALGERGWIAVEDLSTNPKTLSLTIRVVLADVDPLSSQFDDASGGGSSQRDRSIVTARQEDRHNVTMLSTANKEVEEVEEVDKEQGSEESFTLTGKVVEKPQKQGKKKNAFEVPDWLPAVPWAAFVDHRRMRGSPLSDYAKSKAVGKLDKLRAAGHDPAAVIEQSIENDWQGLFELKASSGGHLARQSTYTPAWAAREDARHSALARSLQRELESEQADADQDGYIPPRSGDIDGS